LGSVCAGRSVVVGVDNSSWRLFVSNLSAACVVKETGLREALALSDLAVFWASVVSGRAVRSDHSLKARLALSESRPKRTARAKMSGMRFVGFQLRNFKGIKAVSLDLTKAPSPAHALVGLNESGKTTILEAISSFTYGEDDDLHPLEMPGPRFERDPNSWVPIGERANFNGAIEVSATLRLDDADRRAVAKALKSECGMELKSLSEQIVITEKYNFSASKHTTKNSLWTIRVEGRKVGKGHKSQILDAKSDGWRKAISTIRARIPVVWFFPNFLFELPDLICLEEVPAHSPLEQSKHRFYRQTITDVLSAIDGDMTIADHLVRRIKSDEAADKTSLESLELAIGRELTKTVFGAWNEILGSTVANKEILFEVGNSGTLGATARIRIKDTDGYFELRERSLGFRWFFVFIFLTAYRGTRVEDDRGVIILLDEPASNLHSTAQALLLKSFERLAERCPIVYTTHSHHLINLRWLESTYVVFNSGVSDVADLIGNTASNTSVELLLYRTFVNEHPDRQSYFQPILDLLSYKPSILETDVASILAEGKSDAYLLELFRRSLRPTGSLAVAPGSGAGSLDEIIRLLLCNGRPFVVLLDSDTEGDKQLSRYTDAFGPFLKDRVKRLADFIPDHSGPIEQVLSEADRGLIREAHIPGAKPTKKATSRAVEFVLARDGEFSFDAETEGRALALLDGLSALLDSLSE
jgi:predicted ATP-dependent endonuclease of OLD family